MKNSSGSEDTVRAKAEFPAHHASGFCSCWCRPLPQPAVAPQPWVQHQVSSNMPKYVQIDPGGLCFTRLPKYLLTVRGGVQISLAQGRCHSQAVPGTVREGCVSLLGIHPSCGSIPSVQHRGHPSQASPSVSLSSLCSSSYQEVHMGNRRNPSYDDVFRILHKKFNIFFFNERLLLKFP